MAKQLNVNLMFNADTSKAKQDINELTQSLNKLAYGTPPIGDKLVDPIKFSQASQAARELSVHLNNAFNVQTGKLDLSKLNTSLQSAGTDLNKLTASFKDAGSVGQSAFVHVAQAVATADQPVVTVNSHLNLLWTTLKNVARFQISSSIIHGMIGGIQTAYHYAQDLNESLNNIRIVTGQSAEQMSNFAKMANTTAKQLSATTLDYTNASLIYYQQGLNDEQVAERTATTIKLANVSRQSAEEVSNQMTAIWNNFADGSKSLEYYADVITALGAATASSSAEIAQGLSKFAAVADTVGLSYENATAALATIVATTRQSADTVGTGLRTLFSRLQGLKLGETLEDGVDLNKYSAALKTVGVDALDATGELRSMDNILEDLGEKWKTLSDSQQVALAQTVGGVRQYTTLIALMDNWDFFKQNQGIAGGAEGTLQTQADIYAQSWEAARDRVKAASEELYSSLINENFFIKVDDLLANLIGGAAKFITNLGGIKGLLTAIFSFVATAMSNQVGPMIEKASLNLQIMMGGAKQVYQGMNNQFGKIIQEEIDSGKYSDTEQAQLQGYQRLLAIKTQLSQVESTLSAQEKMQAQIAIQGIELQQQKLIELNQEKERLEKNRNKTFEDLEEENQSDISRKPIINERNKQLKKADSSEDISNILNWEKIASNTITEARSTLIEKLSEVQDLTDLSNIEPMNIGDLFKNLFDFNELDQEFNTLEQEFNNHISSFTDDAIAALDLLPDKFQDNGIGAIIKDTLLPDDQLTADSIQQTLDTISKFSAADQASLAPFTKELQDMLQAAQEATPGFEQLQNKIKMLGTALGDTGNYAPALKQALEDIGNAKTPAQLQQGLQELKQSFLNGKIEAEQFYNVLKTLGASESSIEQLKSGAKDLDTVLKEIAQTTGNLNTSLNNLNFSHTVTGMESLTAAAALAGNLVTSIRAIQSAWNTLNNEDASFGEKLTASLMAVSMLVPSVISGIKNLNKVSTFLIQTKSAAASAILSEAAAHGTLASAETAENLAKALVIAGTTKETAAKAANVIVNNAAVFSSKALSTTKGKEAAAALLSKAGFDEDTAAKILNAIATKNLAIANSTLMASMGLLLLAIIAIIGAFAILNAVMVTPEEAQKGISSVGEKASESDKKIEELNNELKTTSDRIDELQNKGPLTITEQEELEKLLKINDLLKAQIELKELLRGKEAKVNAEEVDKNWDTAFGGWGAPNPSIYKFDERQFGTEGMAREMGVGTSVHNTEELQDFYKNTYGIDIAELLTKDAANRTNEQNKFIQEYFNDLKQLQSLQDKARVENQSRLKQIEDAYELWQKEAALAAETEGYDMIGNAKQKTEDLAEQRKYTYGDAAYKELFLNKALQDSTFEGVTFGQARNENFNFSDKQRKSLIERGIPEEDISSYISEMQDLFVDALEIENVADNLDFSHALQLRDIIESGLQDALNGDYSVASIEGVYAKIQAALDEAGNLDPSKFINFMNLIRNTLNDLEQGDKVSADIMQQIPEELRSMFQIFSDGTGVLIASTERFRKAKADLAMDQLDAQIESSQAGRAITAMAEVARNPRNVGEYLADMANGQRYNSEIEDALLSSYGYKPDEIDKQDKAEILQQVAQQAQQDIATELTSKLTALFQSVGSLEELQQYRDKYLPEQINPNSEYFQIFGEGLMALGSQFESCYDELNNFQEALERGSKQVDELAKELYDSIVEAQMDADNKHGLTDEDLETASYMAHHQMAEYARQAYELEDDEGNVAPEDQARHDQLLNASENIEAAREWAEAEMALYESFEKLKANYADLAKTIKESTEGTADWCRAMGKLQQLLEDIAGTEFDQAFGEEITKMAAESKELQKALKGDKKALNDFRKQLKALSFLDKTNKMLGKTGKELQNLRKDWLKMSKEDLAKAMKNSFNDFAKELLKDKDAMKKAVDAMGDSMGDLAKDGEISFEELETGYDNLMNWLENAEPGEIPPPDVSGFLNALANLMFQAGYTVDQIKAYLESLGMQVHITEEHDTVEQEPIVNTFDNVFSYQPWNVDTVLHIPAGSVTQTIDRQPYQVTGLTVEAIADPSGSAIESKPGGGGGGGGGGEKPKTPKAHKKPDMSKRYHRVKEKLADDAMKQGEAERRKERAFGAEKLNQLEEEIKLRKDQLRLQKEYIDQINGFLKGDRQLLEDALKKNGFFSIDIEFDEQGVIKDYQKIEDQLLSLENMLIDRENAMGESDVWGDLFQRAIDDAREYMDRYEETLNLLEEQTNQASEWIDELSDALFEVVSTKVELKIGINDDEASRLEYFLTKYEDNAYKAAEAISVFGDQAVNQLKRIGIYQEGINELLASKGLTLADLENLDSSTVQKLIEEGDFTEEQINSLREWRDGLIEANEAMMELRTNVAERVLDTFDQLNEKVENSYDLFNHYNSVLETYKDITDLLGRQITQEQRKLIDDLNNSMLENQKNSTIAAKARYDDLVEERAKAQALYDAALAEGGEDAAQKYEEILQNIDEALNDAEEQYLEAWQETMDTAQTIFETMLDNIVKDFENAMSGTFGSMDYLKEAFDRQGKLDENYLDDYDKLYELNKLERELNKVLSDTRGVTNRKALLDLQAKINEYQENGVQLSQYDVDALRAKFELQQAYNDLMLARDAKSTVRLSRDNEGNWGYVYTANQDEVEKAEQTYEDKLHEYQKLNDEYIQTLQEKALEVQTTYRDTLREIMEDITLTDEERDARVKELNDWLMAQQDFFAQQSQNVFDNQSETYDRMLKTYDVAVADLVDSWEETRLAMLTTIENMPDYMQNWQDASNEYLTSLTDALAQRMQVMDDILNVGETSVETFGDHIAGVIEKVGENSGKTVEQVIELAKILNKEFGEAINGAISWEEEYAAQMNAAIEANERMVKSVNDLIAALAEIPSYNHLHDTLTDFLQLSKDYELGKISKAEFDEASKNLNLELENFLGFDEGGYTGAWGSGGRLALLHEKENVFNQEDTANLLDAARLIRQIDMSAAYMATGFGNLSSPDIIGNGFVIQQEVHIEASFPDVTDSAEIEEAFNNLENKAAQYANRKNED